MGKIREHVPAAVRELPVVHARSGPRTRRLWVLPRCAVAAVAHLGAHTGPFGQQPSAAAGTSASPPRYEIVVLKDVMVTMRDGVKLACDIYRPALRGNAVEGKFPLILERTVYGKATVEPWAQVFVARGYIAIGHDIRGRFNSEVTWRSFRHDGNDRYDTVKWIGD